MRNGKPTNPIDVERFTGARHDDSGKMMGKTEKMFEAHLRTVGTPPVCWFTGLPLAPYFASRGQPLDAATREHLIATSENCQSALGEMAITHLNIVRAGFWVNTSLQSAPLSIKLDLRQRLTAELAGCIAFGEAERFIAAGILDEIFDRYRLKGRLVWKDTFLGRFTPRAKFFSLANHFHGMTASDLDDRSRLLQEIALRDEAAFDVVFGRAAA
jgi:hypothetical protein